MDRSLTPNSGPGSSEVGQRAIGAAIEQAYPQAVAGLIRHIGSIDGGEEAAQEAVLRALKTWPRDGLPDNPAAWLARTGRNFHTDQLRHLQMRRAHQLELINAEVRRFRLPDDELDELLFGDDLLRLIFTCCHPQLSHDAQIALTLKVILGLSVGVIAQSLLVSDKAIEKRITRAKGVLAKTGDGYQVPTQTQLEERLQGVLHTIYLVFNSGFNQTFAEQAAEPAGENLCVVGIRLARMLARLFPGHPECGGLLALCLLTHARAPARLSAEGSYVPLTEHDRSLWTQELLAEGRAVIDGVFTSTRAPGAYQLQAAIAALHSVDRVAEVDWQQISGLYELLSRLDNSPVVALNAAVAQANAGSIETAQATLAVLADDSKLKNYQPLYAAIAEVESRAGNDAAARAAYEQAINFAADPASREWLVAQLRKLGEIGEGP